MLLLLAFLHFGLGQTPIAGLSYVVGAGVGDYGSVFVGKEAAFSIVTRSAFGESTTSCIDLARIQIQIRGPQDQLVGSRFTAACVNGEYQAAWTPCLTGWHSIAVTIDGASLQNTPVTVWSTGSMSVEYKLEASAPHVVGDFDGLLRR